jgi:hypothetical protein
MDKSQKWLKRRPNEQGHQRDATEKAFPDIYVTAAQNLVELAMICVTAGVMSIVALQLTAVLATWDIRSKIRGYRAMWKSLPVMWIKRKRYR